MPRRYPQAARTRDRDLDEGFIEAYARAVYIGETLLDLTRREYDRVDVHVRRLRSKVGQDLVTTQRGVGCRLADGVSVRADHAP